MRSLNYKLVTNNNQLKMAITELKNLTIIRKNGIIPDLPFLAIKEKILGKKYVLTVIFCTPQESQERNKTYRDKDYPTNILSFPLSQEEGEIYISLATVRRDAKKFEMSYQKFLHLLMVHGALHLKGLDHGSTMEELEDTYLQQFFCGE
jgi:probable rRNA maturation factor